MSGADTVSSAIPPRWPWKKLKYVASLRSGNTIGPEAIADEGKYPVFGGNGFRGFTSSFTHSGDYVLIGRQGALCGNVNYASGNFWASEHAIVVDPVGGTSVRWLGELLTALNLNRYSQSAAQPGLAVDVIANLEIPVPPEAEQRIIANFLEENTGRLDQLIAAKATLLKVFAEKRKALIAQAVTRGTNPNAPLCDSGIAWLGQIPAHWQTERCAWLFKGRDERGEPELPLLEVSIGSGVLLREFATDRIEGTAADFNTYKIARKGDLVFNKMRMWQGAAGIAPVDGLVSPDYTVASISGELSREYISSLMRTESFSAECARESHGITWDRLRLYWEGFRELRIPIPPREEQRQIVSWINEETSKLDALRLSAEQTIALLKERRSALIAAAVTGQLNISETA